MSEGRRLLFTPQYKQHLAYQAWENDAIDDVIFGGFAGGGKGLAHGQLVLSSKGWKRVEDITLKDKLIAPDGSATKIQGIFPQGERELYKFLFDDQAEIVCDADHLWSTWDSGHGNRDGWQVRSTAEMLKYKGSLSIPTMSKPAPGKKWKGPDPYILGLILGDGTTRSAYTTVYSPDKEIIEYLRERGWRIYNYGRPVDMCQYTKEDFRSILGRHKGKDKIAPPELLAADPETRLAFLQGLLDTDGSCETDGSCRFSSISKNLVESVQYLTRSLGGKARIHIRHKKKPGLGGQNWYYLVTLSHLGKFKPFRLAKKANRIRSKQNGGKRRIVGITKVERGHSTCFKVAHPSHQFITQDFIVTHNTWWGSEAIMKDAIQWPDTRYFIGRKTLTDVLETTFVTLTQKVFPHHKLEQGKHWEFNAQRNQLTFYNGSYVKFLHLGAVPSDPLFDRLGSTEYTRGLIDEASEVPFRAYDVLKSRVGRWKNKELGIKSKLAITLNPTQDWPYRIFYDPWKKAGRPIEPDKPLVSIRTVVEGAVHERTFVFIPAKPGDNEYTAAEYLKNLSTISDPVLRARLMDGDWEFSNAHDVLFPADAIADMFTNKVKRSSDRFLTVDVARYGGDKIVLNHWKGWDSFKIDTHVMLPIHKTADLVRTAMDMWGIPRQHVLIDADGVGGGVVDLLPGCIGFSGGAAPFGVIGEKETRERYENLKTQCIYHAGEKARLRQVAISEPNVTIREMIAEDLQQFKRRDADKDGKLKVVKKEDIISALGHSPDIGDTIVMRSYFDLREREDAIREGGDMHVYIPE